MKFLYAIVILLVFFSCKKAEDRACVKSAGDEATREIVLPDFNRLFLGPHINYTLVQDTVNKMIVSGGKNLLNFVTSDVSDGLLSIENKNKCNFLRSYKKEINVELHFKNIINVLFEGTKPLVCKNQLQLNDVVFVIRDGAGNVDLDLSANSLSMIVTHGWGNFNLHGQVNYLRLEVRSNGFGDAYDVQVNDSVHVISNTQGLIKVNGNNALMRAELIIDGDVWYIGNPSYLDVQKYGNGELIDKN